MVYEAPYYLLQAASAVLTGSPVVFTTVLGGRITTAILQETRKGKPALRALKSFVQGYTAGLRNKARIQIF